MLARHRVVAAIVLAAFATWFFFTPHLAVRGMKAAAQAGDAAKLNDYVNFPALKESLKGSLSAQLASTASKVRAGNPFGALGAALVGAMMGPAIDALVTPESLAMMLKGQKPQPRRSSNDSKAFDDAEVDTSRSYEAFDRFVVTVSSKGRAGGALGLVFLRDGLFSWRLSAIRFPD
jgi:Protein of unknown function (DUF2939)